MRNRTVCILLLILILDQYFVVLEAKKGGGGWFRSGGGFGGRRVDTSPRISPKFGHRLPSLPRSGGFRHGGGGVGRSMMTGALAGLAAGYIGSRIGHHLAGGWHHGRYYHFGDRYYNGPGPHRVRCTIVTPDDFSMRYQDGSRVREIIYECDRYREMCCADGCCLRYH